MSASFLFIVYFVYDFLNSNNYSSEDGHPSQNWPPDSAAAADRTDDHRVASPTPVPLDYRAAMRSIWRQTVRRRDGGDNTDQQWCHSSLKTQLFRQLSAAAAAAAASASIGLQRRLCSPTATSVSDGGRATDRLRSSEEASEGGDQTAPNT